MDAQSSIETRGQLPAWVTGLIVLCCLIELAIVALTLLGFPATRGIATLFAGFWSVLLQSGPPAFAELPAYPGQQVGMFLSYGFLHGGMFHLAMNMVSLLVIARELAKLVTPGVMLMIYLACQITAAALFAVMAPLSLPMVGASGAVFGLAGALVGMVALRRLRRGQPLGPLWRSVGYIVVLNVGLTLLAPQIAWQAHLGGALTGLALGLWLGRQAETEPKRQ